MLFPPSIDNLPGGVLRLSEISYIVDDHRRTLFGEANGNRLPDASGRSGHDRNFVF
jgi:hypothetical protein